MAGAGSRAAARAGTGQVNSTADWVTRASAEAMGAGTGNMRSVTTFESVEARFCEARVRTMYVTAPPGCDLVSSGAMGPVRRTWPSERYLSTRPPGLPETTRNDFASPERAHLTLPRGMSADGWAGRSGRARDTCAVR